jgi:hypothetical protein
LKAVISQAENKSVYNLYFGTCLLNAAVADDAQHNWRTLTEILPRYEGSVNQFPVEWKLHLYRLMAKAEAKLDHEEKSAEYGKRSLDSYLLLSKSAKQRYLDAYPDLFEDLAVVACELKNSSAKDAFLNAICASVSGADELAKPAPYRVAEYLSTHGSYEAADKIYERLQAYLSGKDKDLANELFAVQRRCRNLVAFNRTAQARTIAIDALKIRSPRPDPLIEQMHEELRSFLK